MHDAQQKSGTAFMIEWIMTHHNHFVIMLYDHRGKLTLEVCV